MSLILEKIIDKDWISSVWDQKVKITELIRNNSTVNFIQIIISVKKVYPLQIIMEYLPLAKAIVAFMGSSFAQGIVSNNLPGYVLEAFLKNSP